MVQPKKRTKSSKKRRQSHQALQEPKLITCAKCKKLILPHHACPFCGKYLSRQIIKIKTKKRGKKEIKK